MNAVKPNGGMKINADFHQSVVLDTEQLPWIPSPMPGVHRRMLYREGDEVARATTLVRYAAGSYFSPHRHDGGEEFYVVSGVFSDQHGDYPAGSYVRNPVGSAHKPHSVDGCVILVRLWQMHPLDQTYLRVKTEERVWQDTALDGLARCELHQYDGVQSYFLKHGQSLALVQESVAREATPDSAGRPSLTEVFVIQGPFIWPDDRQRAAWPTASWARFPSR